MTVKDPTTLSLCHCFPGCTSTGSWNQRSWCLNPHRVPESILTARSPAHPISSSFLIGCTYSWNQLHTFSPLESPPHHFISELFPLNHTFLFFLLLTSGDHCLFSAKPIPVLHLLIDATTLSPPPSSSSEIYPHSHPTQAHGPRNPSDSRVMWARKRPLPEIVPRSNHTTKGVCDSGQAPGTTFCIRCPSLLRSVAVLEIFSGGILTNSCLRNAGFCFRFIFLLRSQREAGYVTTDRSGLQTINWARVVHFKGMEGVRAKEQSDNFLQLHHRHASQVISKLSQRK